MRNTVAILGIPIDALDMEQALARLEEFIRSRRFHQVATANTDFLVRALHDPELRSILLEADLVVPDGMPIVVASRWLGAGLKERVTGADMVPRLSEMAAQKGYRLFLLGGKPEVLDEARQRLEAAYPGLVVAGCCSPPPASIIEMDNQEILRQIDESRADVLLVAFGNPKQEKWIHMHRRKLNVPVCIGVGGTFDFIAGNIPRAPAWVQRIGFEWFYRLVQEPRRLWKRYSQDIVHFGRLIVRQLWYMRQSRRAASRLAEGRAGDYTIVSAVGPLDGRLLAELQFVTNAALEERTHVILDLNAATQVDSAVLGTLLNLPKRSAFVGREIRIVGATGRVREALALAGGDGRLALYETLADALTAEPVDLPLVRLDANDRGGVLVLRGSLTEGRVDLLEEALAATLPLARLDLDARGVSRIDSGPLALLCRAATAREAQGCRVRLAAGSAVRDALNRERLLHLFTVVDEPLVAGQPAVVAAR